MATADLPGARLPAPAARVRPAGVSLLAALLLATGAAMLLGITAGLWFLGSGLENGGRLGWVAAGMGLLLIAGGPVAIAVGWGMLRGRGWAWPASLALVLAQFALGLAAIVALAVLAPELRALQAAAGDAEAFEVPVAASAASALLAGGQTALLLWYLTRPGVKAWFGRA
jgi:hypothetical protein